MIKEESLSFLQNCIEKVKNATEQDVQFYKEIYDKECNFVKNSSEFEFVIPDNSIKYEINNKFKISIYNQNISDNKNQMEYTFIGMGSFNQDNNGNLPYAA